MTQCQIGRQLIHKWALEVQAASLLEWQRVMYGHREYDDHAKTCKICNPGIKAKPRKKKLSSKINAKRK